MEFSYWLPSSGTERLLGPLNMETQWLQTPFPWSCLDRFWSQPLNHGLSCCDRMQMLAVLDGIHPFFTKKSFSLGRVFPHRGLSHLPRLRWNKTPVPTTPGNSTEPVFVPLKDAVNHCHWLCRDEVPYSLRRGKQRMNFSIISIRLIRLAGSSKISWNILPWGTLN